MSFYRSLPANARSFSNIIQSFQNVGGLPFTNVLGERDIRKAFDDNECWFGEGEHDVFTPAVTLWAFLSQMLATDAARSCHAAVQRIREMPEYEGMPDGTFSTGGYCKARAKIDERVLQQLLRTITGRAEEKAKTDWTWNGRKHVYLVDGTEVTGCDSAENQAEYPQSDSQAEGCGFPRMRSVVLTSLTRLENGDMLVTWHKPKRPRWMSVAEHDAMPDTLEVRLVEVHVEENFRVRHLFVATTLLDSKTDPSDLIADLFRKRWHVEIDIRSIKTTMGLDTLRGKTPHMMRLEFFVGLLAYNLIRLHILNSAANANDNTPTTTPPVTPRDISFTAAKTTITNGWLLVLWRTATTNHPRITTNLRRLATHRVNHRPGRVEPRVVKRRAKAYPRMKQSRCELRKKLLKPAGDNRCKSLQI